MQLTDFTYDLPEDRIAQVPAEPRDSARLFVYNRATDTITHAHIRDLPSFLPPKTLIIANNSKVRKARIFTNDEREVLVLERVHGSLYRTMIRGTEPKPGKQFFFSDGICAWVRNIERHPAMTTVTLEFNRSYEDTEAFFERSGEMPLPPYITERAAAPERYQTIYAGPLGSAAAPTAGLHLTPELLENLKAQGHQFEQVTLHVGIGTFLPLRNETIEKNKLHAEVTTVDESVAALATATIEAGGPLLTVGTTALRTLEGHWKESLVRPGTQETNIFLYPGQRIHTANYLLTNFHLPKSSLLVLIATFLAGSNDRTAPLKTEAEAIALTKRLYQTAVAEQYRFFSFGDAMLIL